MFPAEKPAKKVVAVKQYLVWGSENPEDAKAERKAYFILATCAINARKDFEERFEMKATQCAQTAESEFTKDDLPKHDFWKEEKNWELELGPEKEMSESAKKYFETKDMAEKVQAAKAKVGIGDWETATEEQLKALRQTLDRKNS